MQLLNDKCYNCSYDCCCKCVRENCGYCSKREGYKYSKCSEVSHDRKMLCLACKKIWPYTFSPSIYNTNVVCSRCNNKGTIISHTIRIPKINNRKKWDLLKKLLYTHIFENCKSGTLGKYWYDNGGLGCTLHVNDAVRAQFKIPRHNREFDDWITYMKTTKIIF